MGYLHFWILKNLHRSGGLRARSDFTKPDEIQLDFWSETNPAWQTGEVSIITWYKIRIFAIFTGFLWSQFLMDFHVLYVNWKRIVWTIKKPHHNLELNQTKIHFCNISFMTLFTLCCCQATCWTFLLGWVSKIRLSQTILW